jgi:hypothetical protein
LFSPITAQWNFSLSTMEEFSSNPFRSVDSYSDFISTFDFGIEREFAPFNILYFGSYTRFNNSENINYYWHQLGIYKESKSFIWGAYFEQRINKDENNYLDYLNYAGYLRKSFNYADINWKANLSFNSMNYSVLPDFNNWVATVELTGNKSFETKTTFIGTMLFNYKGFKNIISQIDTVHGTETLYYISENVNISQIDLNARVAQSLSESSGLALNFNYKSIISGSGFSASLIESTYGDMELYDDPISQEGYSLGGIFTQVFPSTYIFKLSYYYYNKVYPSQGIYYSNTEYNENLERKDKQSLFSTSISKSFILDEESGSEFSLLLNYYIINNKSNSYFFNYDVNALSLSLNFTF